MFARNVLDKFSSTKYTLAKDWQNLSKEPGGTSWRLNVDGMFFKPTLLTSIFVALFQSISSCAFKCVRWKSAPRTRSVAFAANRHAPCLRQPSHVDARSFVCGHHQRCCRFGKIEDSWKYWAWKARRPCCFSCSEVKWKFRYLAFYPSCRFGDLKYFYRVIL